MVLTRKTKKINLLDRSRSRSRWCLDFPFLDRRLPPKVKRRRIHPKKHFFFILLKREKYYSWCYIFFSKKDWALLFLKGVCIKTYSFHI